MAKMGKGGYGPKMTAGAGGGLGRIQKSEACGGGKKTTLK